MSLYKEYKQLNLSETDKEILKWWGHNEIFEKSISEREGHPRFIFYEGPPSANGLPGIHHVMSRTIKDIFCRYKTQKGFQVQRKAGWDTHGLPVELGVEKELGITKEDIGKTISIVEYNKACRKAVMKYTDVWNDLTLKMGYWVDMENPYITYKNQYIESVWWLLKQIYDKGLLYKGYTIQPYSPAAGTGLSSHELNQPGCYKDVKDTTIVAQFKALDESKITLEKKIGKSLDGDLFFLAWTTTPWTLPSNTALCVGPNIDYLVVRTLNPYTNIQVNVVVAKNLLDKVIPENKKSDNFLRNIVAELKGSELKDLRYEQLLPYTLPYQNADQAFRIITGDFVTTEDGTGIVHIAPTFGADDAKVAKEAGVPPMLILDENNNPVPLVDMQGKFRKELGELGGMFVKNEYYDANAAPDKSADVMIAIKLKKENKAFKVEKYEHTYPHCWRTDKPILYYPLNSWFIKVTAVKSRMVELNKTINWKPESTGTGRFGNWLENANDWNLSRSRFWGIPLPIWRNEEGEEKCIGSVKELKEEIDKAVAAGLMSSNPLADFDEDDLSDENYNKFDLHRPYVDDIILVSHSGKALKRELDLIDVWFDSGAMPYAQIHYPFSQSQTLSKGKGLQSNSTFGYKTANKGLYKLIKELKDEKVKRETEAEKVLWEQLKGKKLDGYKFRRQHIIDTYITDFVCLSKGLVIEVDGGYHNTPHQIIADAERDEFLLEKGFETIRFTNEEVLGDIEGVLQKIKTKIKEIETKKDFTLGVGSGEAKKVLPLGLGSDEAKKVLPLGEDLGGAFPADFIAEGVDQTRGWFYTLHAIATLVFDSVAYKNVVSNGLVLDKNGQKMSKRLGNAIDPFTTIEKYGADATRWYMISNAQPWDNLKFDLDGITEVQRKFFGTLFNTYSFFALYANIDKFKYTEKDLDYHKRPMMDRWILSLLNTLTQEVDKHLSEYEPTKAARAIQDFVGEDLSNWYVRLSRRRFWKGTYTEDKISAYQTLYTCLETIAKLMAPIAPFYSERLFRDLNQVSGKDAAESVHLALFPTFENEVNDPELEADMRMAQKLTSLILSIRKKEKIRVRQPLTKVLIPILKEETQHRIERLKDLVLSEVNIKSIEYLDASSQFLNKKIKADFKKLGPKFGKSMKMVATLIAEMTQDQIRTLEADGEITLSGNGETFNVSIDEVEIISENVPGYSIATDGTLTVALDITITHELWEEGIARDLVNRIQNIRKERNFEVTDRIEVHIEAEQDVQNAITNNLDYICVEILADKMIMTTLDNSENVEIVELPDNKTVKLNVKTI